MPSGVWDKNFLELGVGIGSDSPIIGCLVISISPSLGVNSPSQYDDIDSFYHLCQCSIVTGMNANRAFTYPQIFLAADIPSMELIAPLESSGL
jgi:hypothetical protein